MKKDDSNSLIGKCGFYCASCPIYIAGKCKGCVDEHTAVLDKDWLRWEKNSK